MEAETFDNAFDIGDIVAMDEISFDTKTDSDHTEVSNLLATWELSSDTIDMVLDCRVNTLSRLKMLNTEDINEIFNSRGLIGEKVCFRYYLQKWRAENNYGPLLCSANDSTLPEAHQVQQFSYAPSMRDSQINLGEILQNTVDGKDIIAKYQTCSTLSEKDQTSIVRIIVDHYMLNDRKMEAKTMESIAQAIINLFPTETETSYYIPRTKTKNASGKLYDRYYNQRNKRKRLDSIGCSKLCKQNEERKIDEIPECLMDVAEFQAKKKWLLHNFPLHITIPWKATSVLRMRENKTSLRDFLNDWPRYKDPKGYELIDVDFETLYPGKQNLMFEKIADLEKVMVEEILPIHVKDKLNVQYFEKMKTATDINTRHYHFFCLLHSIITPPRVTKISKPSITDAQSDMIVHLFNLNDFAQKKDELRELALRDKTKIQPKVFVIGETCDNLSEFIVVFNDITYKVETLLRALDVVIKICFTFDLKYSVLSKYVWVFLQEFIYNIPSLEKIAKVQNILNKLKNVK